MKTRIPVINKGIRVLCNHSDPTVATGFPLMPRRTWLTPGTAAITFRSDDGQDVQEPGDVKRITDDIIYAGDLQASVLSQCLVPR